ncbi:MAG: hypothetical protein QW632_00965 [Ignisphaera sp.]
MSNENEVHVINDVKTYLEILSNAKENAIKLSRDILVYCRRLIISCLYNDCNTEYAKKLEEAFSVFRKQVMQHPELLYSNFYTSVEAEYVEAITFYHIVAENKFKTFNELNIVRPASYILGLLDVIGELKRYSLELIEKDKYDESLKIFKLAEKIFNEVSELGHLENVVPGLKRKIDVYRKVLDDWRELLIDLLSRIRLVRTIESARTGQVKL